MDEYINGLRIIKTVRDFSEVDINNLVDKGYQPIIKKIEPLSDLYITIKIWQNKKNKKIMILDSNIKRFLELSESSMKEYELIETITYYPYKFEKPYAAYLIPLNIQINEKVFVSDLIEDYVGSTHFHSYKLKSCEAIWDGKELEILYKPENITHLIG